MDISSAFAPSMETPMHIELAERLGYQRAWCYDSPGLYPDVWMVLALAASRTNRIGLGPAVLVPSLRHPMVNASALANLELLAPQRAAAVIGTGFTGRNVFGHGPLPWGEVRQYIVAMKGLLAGKEVMWDGKPIKMLHPPGFAPERPLSIPVLVAADGPRGMAVAAEVGDGILSAAMSRAPIDHQLSWRAVLTFGTVLYDGEVMTSERAMAAAGPAAAVAYHMRYEHGGEAVDRLPGGATWRRYIDPVPPDRRHLAIHEGHLVTPNAADTAALAEAGDFIAKLTFTGTAAALRARLDEFRVAGTSELIYQPAGPDIERELRAFADMAEVAAP